MKDGLFKYLPIALGLLFGWLLASPPEFLAANPQVRAIVVAGLVAVLFVGFVALTLALNLPEDIALDPEPGVPVPPELAALSVELQVVGFQPAGPLTKAGLKPPALLLPLVHEAERTYAAVFRTGTAPARTAFELVSRLETGGALSTSAERAGGYLPPTPGAFKQVFPGTTATLAFERHREGIAYLRSRGIGVRPATAADFVREYKTGVARSRRAFLASPVARTLTMLYRAVTSSTPHLGPIAQQPLARKAIEEAQTGRSS